MSGIVAGCVGQAQCTDRASAFRTGIRAMRLHQLAFPAPGSRSNHIPRRIATASTPRSSDARGTECAKGGKMFTGDRRRPPGLPPSELEAFVEQIVLGCTTLDGTDIAGRSL